MTQNDPALCTGCSLYGSKSQILYLVLCSSRPTGEASLGFVAGYWLQCRKWIKQKKNKEKDYCHNCWSFFFFFSGHLSIHPRVDWKKNIGPFISGWPVLSTRIYLPQSQKLTNPISISQNCPSYQSAPCLPSPYFTQNVFDGMCICETFTDIDGF